MPGLDRRLALASCLSAALVIRALLAVMFVLSSVGHAQEAVGQTEEAAPPPPAPHPPAPAAFGPLAAGTCRADYHCPGRERCIDNVCTVPVSQSSTTGSGVSVNVGMFGELFPISSVRVPGSSSSYQMSVLAGLRVGVGYHLPKWLRAMGVLEGGYTAAGKAPGKGEQGLSIGFGVEGDLDYFQTIKPFLRFTYDVVVTRLSSSGEGRLADSAWLFAAGIRINIVDLHLMVGSDFAGGISPGIGFGFGWMN